ncbi:MAG: aryl-sulfate sulfotransferase [Eubacteriaceae bacterium]|nr:aryl-sulfate sulfotransferase [Eubacteriaceae bacterium]
MDSSRKFIIVSVSAAVLLIILVSCTLAYAGRDNTLMSDKTLNLEINGFNVELPLAEDGGVYDAVSLSAGTPNTIKLKNEVGATVKIDEKGIGGGNTIELKLDELSMGKLIKIEVGNEKDKRIIYLRTLSSQLPQMTTTGESPYEGNYYATLNSAGAVLYELNSKGDVIFYIAKTPEEAKGETYWDFKKHVLEDEKIRYSYQRSYPGGEATAFSDNSIGERVILDENYREIKTITLLESKNAKAGDPVDGHDFILISDDHYIVSANQLKFVENIPAALGPNPMGAKVVRTLLQEVNADKVVFEFTSDAYPELYGLSTANNDYNNTTNQSPNYANFNSMTIDPVDNNLICSFENLNTIMKINRETGAILWKLSGAGDEFGLTENQKTSKQNYVRLTDDGYLTIFDDANSSGQTRILKLKLDEVNKKVLEYKEYKIPGHTTIAGGSTQKVGDGREVYTVGWGSNTDGLAALTEVDFTSGKKLFEMTLPQGVSTYRIQKFK